MKKLIIVDFNRTLYDPDKKELMQGAKEFLEEYSKNYSIALIGKGGGERNKLINSLDIKKYFDYFKLVSNKSVDDFHNCLNYFNLKAQDSWSFGDRIKREIVLSNKVGLKTIWFKNGKFADEIPNHPDEEPNFTIRSFDEVKNIILL